MLHSLKMPRAVIFDYGETLAHEDGFDAGKGFAAILEYAVCNPKQADSDELLSSFGGCYRQLRLNAHAAGVEIPNIQRWRWLFEMYGLEFSLTAEALEPIFWDAAAPCVPTPHMPQLLAMLREKGILTGVISNMGFSGRALTARLKRFFPEHPFAFVMSSADYVLRKPNPLLFELALKKAGCSAGEAWFCGDNPAMDIVGAHAAGMVPVFYDRDLGCAYREPGTVEEMPPCLRIEDWSELMEALG